MTFGQIASLVSASTGRQVGTTEITLADVRNQLEQRGMARWEAGHFEEMYQLFRDGRSEFVTGDVERLLGRPPARSGNTSRLTRTWRRPARRHDDAGTVTDADAAGDCLLCAMEHADDNAIVFRDGLWAAEIVPRYDVPGWFILRARRARRAAVRPRRGRAVHLRPARPRSGRVGHRGYRGVMCRVADQFWARS